ncbi:hypothetical protein SLEP1_g47535 [Rubroshorea leprosula]|uniref:Uncharacterized protein n=1 Tax=Rubroshorea leprosula TaxID=152421 RepID=A0AAV5LSJ0_9ROSI|nr:hypothetical protein SLEP1_g47535 [Rubroshorea leprosula]
MQVFINVAELRKRSLSIREAPFVMRSLSLLQWKIKRFDQRVLCIKFSSWRE